jgi:hypothetical protein
MASPRVGLSARSQQSFTVLRSTSHRNGVLDSINPAQDAFYANVDGHINFLQRVLSKEHEQSVMHLRSLLQKLQEENNEYRKRLDLTIVSGLRQKIPAFGALNVAPPDFSYWSKELHKDAPLSIDRQVPNTSRTSPKAFLPSRFLNDPSEPIAEKDEDVITRSVTTDITKLPVYNSKDEALNNGVAQMAQMESEGALAQFGNCSNEFRLRSGWRDEEQMSKADNITIRMADMCDAQESQAFDYDFSGLTKASFHLPVGILSPQAHFLVFWNVLFMVVLTYELVMTPMGVFQIPQIGVYKVLFACCMFFWSLDIPLTMNTAYYTSAGDVVYSRRTIMKHYARGWLLPDLLLVSIDWLEFTGLMNHSAGGMMRGGKAVKAFRVLRVLRILRMRKLREVLQAFDEFVNSQYFTIIISMVMNVASILFISHLMGCVWFLIGEVSIPSYPSWVKHYDFQDKDWEYQYLTSLHWSITQFTPGSMSVQPQNILERGFAILVLVAGMIIFSSIVSSITAATNGLKSMNSRYRNEIWRMRKFCKENQISQELLQAIMRYSENFIMPKMAKVNIKEVDLLMYLPKKLHMQVMLEMWGKHLEVHPLFKKLKHRDALADLCTTCVEEVVVDNGDTLFVSSQQAHSMHFVLSGKLFYKVMITQMGGMGSMNGDYANGDAGELKTEMLEAHQHYIAEAVLWTHWVYQGTCSSMGHASSVANVNYLSFQTALADYRVEFMLARRYGIAYVRAMNEMSGYDTESEEDDCNLSDVLGEVQGAIALLEEKNLRGTLGGRSTSYDTRVRGSNTHNPAAGQ